MTPIIISTPLLITVLLGVFLAGLWLGRRVITERREEDGQ